MTAQTADFLASVPMFSGLQRDELLKFAELTRERTYPKGSVILFQGDPGDSLYVLRQGRVKVVLIGEDGPSILELGSIQFAGQKAAGEPTGDGDVPPPDLQTPASGAF